MVAGFFACLLIEKRGIWRFIGNRALRVALPFLAFTSLLYPVMFYQMVAGGIESGRIQTAQTAWQVFIEELSRQKLAQIWPMHFWFLYVLVILYALSLLLFFAFRYVLDRKGRLRNGLQVAFGRVLCSRFGLIALSAPIAGLLFWDSIGTGAAWFGVDTGPMNLKWAGVFAYWIFFAAGWCVFRQPELLHKFEKGWYWQVAAGTVISCGLCYWCNALLISGKVQWAAPMMGDTEILRYDVLRQKLLASKDIPGPSPAKAVWSKLSPEYQRFLEKSETATADELAGVALELSLKCIASPTFAEPAIFGGLPLGEPWRSELRRSADHRPLPRTMALNRRLLAAAFAPAIAESWTGPVWMRGAFFSAYALASWLLVCGTIGFFNRVLTQPSRLFRYLADASYWLYIIHLPIQFQIQLWLAPLEMQWFVKYVIYLVISFAVMLPSYHYLVRSTWIGVFLNGRRHEFVPWFSLRKKAAQPADSTAPLASPAES